MSIEHDDGPNQYQVEDLYEENSDFKDGNTDSSPFTPIADSNREGPDAPVEMPKYTPADLAEFDRGVAWWQK